MKLIFFDLDGTLVDEETFDYIYPHLWAHFGVDKSETKPLRDKYLNGQITYQQWVDNDVRLLQNAGATKASIMGAIGTLRPTLGAIDTLTELKRRGYKIFVISGGINLLLELAFPDYAAIFEDVFINRYVFDQNGHLLHGVATPYDEEHKATGIRHTAAKHNLPITDTVFIGDNINDVQAAQVAGLSIAFNAKSPELIQIATHHVDSRDLRDILPLIP